MEKTRVLLVSNTLSCGGAERQITLIANALNRSGKYEVDVLYYAQKGGEFSSVLERKPLFVDKDKLGSIGCVRAIARILREGGYDIMHAAGGGTANLYGRAAALLAKTPVNLGMMLGKRHFAGRAMRLANCFLNLFSNDWAVNNPALIPILSRDLIRIRKERVYLLYNSFSPASTVDYRAGQRTKYDEDRSGAFVFGTVGRCVKIKNFPLFLRAAKRVLARHENVRFWLLGDGEQLQSLRALANELEISHAVRFWGFCDDVDVALLRMDAYVQSSDSEGTPNTVLEAMRAAKPVISTDNTDLSHIVEDKVNGLITPCGDEAALAEAMERMLSLSEEERRAMGKASSELFEASFLEERAVETWDTLYQTLLERKR